MSTEVKRQNAGSVIRNVIYGSMTWLLPLGLSFVATPVIVRSLGNNDYGIYALVLGFIGYSFTFSLGRPITKYIAEYRATGESEKIRDVISASFFLNIVFGIFALAVICGLANWLVHSVFRIEPDARDRTVLAFYIASAIIFMSMLNQVLSSVIQGVQRFDVYSKVTTASSFSLIVGNLILAYLGFGLTALLYWNLGVLAIFCVVLAVIAKRLLPEFTIGLRFSRATLKMVVGYSTWTILYQLFANVLLLFERGWITQRLGSDELTHYVVPMALAMQLHAFISSLVLVIFPLASELKDEKHKLLALYLKATKAISFIVVFMVASVVVQSSLFLGLWMGKDFAERSSAILIMQMACFGLISILSIAWQMTEGLGHPRFNALTIACSTTIGVSLMVIFIGPFGTSGVAAARLAGFVLVFLSVFYVEKWFFEGVQVRFWARIAGSLFVAAAIAGSIEYGATLLLPQKWTTLFLSVGLGGLAYCVVLWFLDFVTADEKLLVKRLIGR
ncbi:MAG: oligosaccharide flippase family protein [Pyrinomonadaceae bacterium]|nr:oligosaccharide flippase family protein [Pyrinomonadaceae bacterium]